MSQTAISAVQPPQVDRLGELANFCKATADQLRLQILRVLHNESFGVSELCNLFDIRQPAMSHHLKVLASAGLVATRREGNSIYYRRGAFDQSCELKSLQSNLFATVDRVELPVAVSVNDSKIQLIRSDIRIKIYSPDRKFRTLLICILF